LMGLLVAVEGLPGMSLCALLGTIVGAIVAGAFGVFVSIQSFVFS